MLGFFTATRIPNADCNTIMNSPQCVMYRKNISTGPQNEHTDQMIIVNAHRKIGILQKRGDTLSWQQVPNLSGEGSFLARGRQEHTVTVICVILRRLFFFWSALCCQCPFRTALMPLHMCCKGHVSLCEPRRACLQQRNGNELWLYS